LGPTFTLPPPLIYASRLDLTLFLSFSPLLFRGKKSLIQGSQPQIKATSFSIVCKADFC
jgi:hypothetical protein